jgi:hypothetical protein
VSEWQPIATAQEIQIASLRRLAAAIKRGGDEGIAALVYYAAELLEDRRTLPVRTVMDAIRGTR